MRSAMAASTRAGSSPQSSDSCATQRPASSLNEFPALLQVAQRLDGEKGMPAGLCIERIPETAAPRRLGSVSTYASTNARPSAWSSSTRISPFKRRSSLMTGASGWRTASPVTRVAAAQG